MSRHLIVGAGASYAEAAAAGLPEHLRPPFISNFAQKMWSDYNPAILLSAYLTSHGERPLGDPRELFLQLEKSRPVDFNVERFFEFAWQNRDEYPGEWENLLSHGILNPLVFMFSQGLWKNGIADAPLRLSPSVAAELKPGDVVLDLNYDTLFEIGAVQAGHKLAFIPNKPAANTLLVAKPHGSINMVVNAQRSSFAFGALDWPGSPQPAGGSANFLGFIPPRQYKSYSEHPWAKMILDPIQDMKPRVVTFWGIGFTNSDVELMLLYETWCTTAEKIEVINPDSNIAESVRNHLGDDVSHFADADTWKANHVSGA
jgi:hypothetical protein